MIWDDAPNGLLLPRPAFFIPGAGYPPNNPRRRSNVVRTTGGIYTNNSNLTTYTSTAISLGGVSPSATRLVTVTLTGQSATNGIATVSAATIGGVTASVLVEQGDPGVTSRASAHIIAATVPTGTTAVVAVTMSKTMNALTMDLQVLEGCNNRAGNRFYTAYDATPSVIAGYNPGGGSVGLYCVGCNGGATPTISNTTSGNYYALSNSGNLKSGHAWLDDTGGVPVTHASANVSTDQAMAGVIFY
jgi:hypothetical protein